MALLTVWPTETGGGVVATEDRWRKMARLWVPSGVVNDVGGLMAPSLVAGPGISVADGACWVDGHYCTHDSTETIAASSAGLLVARWTAATQLAELIYRDAATTPTQTTAVWELPIAKITAGALTDLRVLIGSSGIPPVVLRKMTPKTVNTTVAETDLLNGEITIPAGAMGINGLVRLVAWGDTLNNNAIAAIPRWKLKLGATTIIDTGTSGTTWLNSANRLGWKLFAEIQNLGATNAQSAEFDLQARLWNNNAILSALLTVGQGGYFHHLTSTSPTFVSAMGTNAAAEDTTAAKALALTVILPASAATVEARLLAAVVQVIP